MLVHRSTSDPVVYFKVTFEKKISHIIYALRKQLTDDNGYTKKKNKFYLQAIVIVCTIMCGVNVIRYIKDHVGRMDLVFFVSFLFFFSNEYVRKTKRKKKRNKNMQVV